MPVIGLILAIPVAIIAIAWAFGAVWFDAPFGNANKIVAGLLAIAAAIALAHLTAQDVPCTHQAQIA